MTLYDEVGIELKKVAERRRTVAVYNDVDDRVKIVIAGPDGDPIETASINYEDARCLEIMLSSVLDVIALRHNIQNRKQDSN